MPSMLRVTEEVFRPWDQPKNICESRGGPGKTVEQRGVGVPEAEPARTSRRDTTSALLSRAKRGCQNLPKYPTTNTGENRMQESLVKKKVGILLFCRF